MRPLVLKAALLAALPALSACAQDAAKPDELETVVITGSRIPSQWVIADPPQSRITDVDRFGLPEDAGARYPSTTWVLYLH